MAPRTPPAEPETETESGSGLTLDDVRSAISEAIGGLFDSGKAEVVDTTETTTAKAPAKRRTYREDEDEMEGIISAKVKELLAKEKAEKRPDDDDKGADKAPPEVTPEKPKARLAERVMGWRW